MTRVAAVILAGGKAERLGGINKALIEIGGETLLTRAIRAVAGCDPMLLAIGRTPFQSELREIRDLETDYAGPLAGVAAAVDALDADPPDLLLSLAVDTADFPADFLARALPLAATAPAVLAAYAGQDYPTNALWQFASLAGLPAALRAGTAPHSLKRLAASLGQVSLDYAGLQPEDPFRNINTLEDLSFFQQRDASRPAG